MGGFSLWHILILAIILLLVFGGNGVGVGAENRQVDRNEDRAEPVAGLDAMALGQPDEAGDFLRLGRSDSAGGELAFRQLRAALLIVAAARVVDGVVPQDRPAEQPLFALRQFDLLKLSQAIVEMLFAVIVSAGPGISGSGAKLGLDQAAAVGGLTRGFLRHHHRAYVRIGIRSS